MVTTLARLRQTQLEGFLSRCTGSHTAALFLREVLYWLSPSRKAPARPRSTVFRNGSYWMARTREEWKELDITRTNLSTIYRRCKDIIETDHFMFSRQRQTHYRIRFEKLRELMERDETLQACLRTDTDAAQARRAVSRQPCSPLSREGCSSSVHSVEQSFHSLESTSACSATPHSGAAAPEPPPPARSVSALDSVEVAPERPEMTTFKQARVILQAAEGEPTKEKLGRVIPYGERTRLALGYLLMWQGEWEKLGQKYFLCEAHFLQAVEFADEGVPLTDFYRTLRAAWEVVPSKGFDPLFLCRHARKLTLFFKHFETMTSQLAQEGEL